MVTPTDVTYKRKFRQYLELLPCLDKPELGTKVSEINAANPVARQAGWRWHWCCTRSMMVVVMHRDNFGTGDGWYLFPPELYNPLGLQESCFPSGPVAMVHLLAS